MTDSTPSAAPRNTEEQLVVQEIFRRAEERRAGAAGLSESRRYADAAYWKAVAVGMEQVAFWLQSGDLHNTTHQARVLPSPECAGSQEDRT